MPAVSMTTVAARIKRISITIPGSAGTAVTVRSLIASGLTAADTHNVVGGRINIAAADYKVGDTAASQPLTITAGLSYTEPTANFLDATYVKSAAAGTVTAVVSVWLAGDGNTPF